MPDYPFDLYGFSTTNPPPLHTVWNEQRRPVDLSGRCHVFTTSPNATPWRQRGSFPNADMSSIRVYANRYSDRRVKMSQHWSVGNLGAVRSRVFRSQSG